MIPADLVARLRLLTEASFFQTDPPVQELRPIRGIQADLPEFSPGQRITATIEEQLPNGLFRALVAGKAINLAVAAESQPELSQPGRTLNLEVVQTQRQVVHAKVVAAPAEVQAGPPPRLSQAGQLISILLTGRDAETPALLGAGKPLVERPPESAGPLASALQKALSESGLFYESHQERWLEGDVTTAALKREPQGRLAPAAPQEPSPIRRPDAHSGALDTAGQIQSPPSMGEEADKIAAAPRPLTDAGSPDSRPVTQLIPDRLLPLVSQQLDALATQHFSWQGQAWPGQALEWDIEDPGQDASADPASPRPWRTSLRLTLPHLGTVEARLGLVGQEVQVTLRATEPTARSALDDGRAALAEQLVQAGLKLVGIQVDHGDT